MSKIDVSSAIVGQLVEIALRVCAHETHPDISLESVCTAMEADPEARAEKIGIHVNDLKPSTLEGAISTPPDPPFC